MAKYDTNFFLFLKEIKKYRQLSNRESILLVKKYQLTQQDSCLNSIILGNIRFIISRAVKFSNNRVSVSDLIFPGMRGIKRAAIKFDINRPIKFITYASYWVEMFMRRELIRQSSLVKITPRAWELSTKISKLRNTGISNRQILRKLNIKRKTLYNIRSLKNDVSLNLALTDSRDGAELEKLILIDETSPANIYSKKDLNYFLLNQLDFLSTREKNILIRRYGLNETKSLTLGQLSQLHNISAERVRQVIINSLAKLRKRLKKEKF